MHEESQHGFIAVPGMKVHSPYFVMPISVCRSLRSSSGLRLLLHSAVRNIRQKGMLMKLKIRYENEYQTV